jgi:hypothetical protein
VTVTYDATKKSVISARERGAVRSSQQGVLQAFALSTAGKDRMGEAMWTLKYEARDRPKAFRIARALLVHSLEREASATLYAVCGAALAEWLHEQCSKCHGRGKTGAGREVIEAKRVRCGGCHGTGRIFTKGTMSEVERPHAACYGKGWTEKRETKLSRLRGCITCHGTGKRIYRDRERALALQMTGHQFAAWKGVYNAALRNLRAMDLEVAIGVDVRRGRIAAFDSESFAKVLTSI